MDIVAPESPAACMLSLSGGLDSTVLCAELLRLHGPGAVQAVFFSYGSKHNIWELNAAKAVAAHFGLGLTVIALGELFRHMDSGLLADDPREVPASGYSEETMRTTAVPGRNLIFAASLAALAESRNIPAVALATHSGDHALYPDCRPAFNASLAETVSLSSGGAVSVLTPFSAMDKAGIVRLGLNIGAPLALTRSCYRDQSLACGTCGTCVERLQAFAANSTSDPVAYAD